jgi:poly-beta-1,6-N-acetyl-D-glucosamine synthase
MTWIDDLSRSLTMLGAVLLICGIAIVPGYLNVQIAAALLLDRPRPLPNLAAFPVIAIVIAAHNEEGSIGETLEYATAQAYPGEVNVIVADEGSTDATPSIVGESAARNHRVQLLPCGTRRQSACAERSAGNDVHCIALTVDPTASRRTSALCATTTALGTRHDRRTG